MDISCNIDYVRFPLLPFMGEGNMDCFTELKSTRRVHEALVDHELREEGIDEGGEDMEGLHPTRICRPQKDD